MKNKIIKMLPVTLIISFSVVAQNPADFTGIYAVKQRCWEFSNNWQEITEYEIEVNLAANDTVELKVNLVLLKPYALGFNVKNDSMFWIYNHLFLNQDSTIQYVAGSGFIYKDSIDLNMTTASNNGIFKCDCNGNKIGDVEVGLQENTLLNEAVKLYPNPVKNELQVLWPILSGKTYNYYRIFNTNGQSVLENKSQSFESIDVSELPFGTYIIHFLVEDVEVASNKFIKVE